MTRADITTEMDAAAAAQAGEAHTLVIRGVEFTLPGGSLPWDVQVEISRFAKEQSSPFPSEQAGSVVALADAMRLVFGAEQYERVKELARSTAEQMVVVNAVTQLYTGATVGEAVGSDGSSKSTGAPQRPTSSATTDSPSDPASLENGNSG